MKALVFDFTRKVVTTTGTPEGDRLYGEILASLQNVPANSPSIRQKPPSSK